MKQKYRCPTCHNRILHDNGCGLRGRKIRGQPYAENWCYQCGDWYGGMLERPHQPNCPHYAPKGFRPILTPSPSGEIVVENIQRRRVKARMIHEPGYGSHEAGRIECAVDDPEATLVSSKIVGYELHAPTIDIDLPCQLIPSATPDHYHLLIEKVMTWDQYQKFLDVMVEVGLVEKGYVKASKRDGYSAIRIPGVLKYEVEHVRSSVARMIEELEKSI